MSSLAQKKQERAAQDEREAEEQRAQRVQQEQDRHERYLNAVREFVKREPIGGISSTHAFLSPFKTSHEPTSGEHRSNVATFPAPSPHHPCLPERWHTSNALCVDDHGVAARGDVADAVLTGIEDVGCRTWLNYQTPQRIRKQSAGL